MALQGPLRGRPAAAGAQDPGNLRGRAGRILPLQRRGQGEHLGRGPQGHLAGGRGQRGEPAGPPGPDPAVQAGPRHRDRLAERPGMLAGGQLADQPPALAGSQPGIGCLADQRVTEQRDGPGPPRPASVLISSGTHDGDSSRPALTELASSPGDRLTSRPARRPAAAAVAAVTAATASAAADPVGGSGGGSASSAHSHTVNSPRTSSARAANRASQSRTVDAGLPSTAAIGRCPSPAALPASAAQITATPSARRSRQLTGSSTCVTPQPPHRDRRGRSRHPIPPSPRITRSRACPHPASRPRHPGQRNRPAASRRSTTHPTTPTVTIGASAHPARPSRHLGQEKDGRAAAYPDLITVASHTKKDNPAGLPSRPSSPQTTLARRYVLKAKVA